MGSEEENAFLTLLEVEGQVSAATQGRVPLHAGKPEARLPGSEPCVGKVE